jgi:hypothetical protein
MKVGGGNKPPPQQPPTSSHHVRPHKAHGPRNVTGGFKTIKSKSASSVDPSSLLGDELSADEIDSLQKLEATGESGQQGFSGQQQRELPVGPKLEKQPKQQEGVTLTEPHLHAMLASVCAQLDELAQEIDLAMGHPLAPGQPNPADLKRVKTEEQLRDILRQVMSGDFGFKLGTDPNTTLGRLFWQLKGWPRGVPPRRKPSQQAPWSADEWDEFVAWLNAPPPLPPDDELL